MKIRCSQIGKIMSNPRTKGEILSKTTKTYIKELFIETEYNKTREFWSKYTDKGNSVEEDSIELCQEHFNNDFLHKNIESFENDYLTGTPDIITKNNVIEIKSSWSAFTFPFFETELPNKDYFYQVQGYLELTGKDKGYLVYCLVNTPENLIQDEIYINSLKNNEIQLSVEIEESVRNNHTFDNIPKHKRIKIFEIERNEAVIKSIYERIDLCREYYNELLTL